MVKPAHENFLGAQFFEPDLGGKLRRARENEIGLAGKNFEAEGVQLAAELVTSGNNLAKIRAIIRQIIQGRERGDLAEAVDVVAVADFVERGNEFGMAHEIPDSLQAERVSFGKRAGDQHVRIS